MTCRFSFDDGAYVLGALAPADRAEFERHLPSCAPCRKAVAGLAVIPGLLGRLDPATAIPSGPAPSTFLPRTLAAVATRRHAEQRRRTWYALGAALAAVCLAAVVGIGVHLVDSSRGAQPSASLTAMRPVAASKMPVSAEVGLVAIDGGTRIEMRCRYASGYDGQWTVRLVVYPRSGGAGEQIGTWAARSGQEVSVSALTHLPAEEIARVELHRDDGSPLLSWTPT